MKSILLIFIALPLSICILAQQERRLDERHTAGFRYAIIVNDVEGGDSPYRSISVLLDEVSFSNETLKKLFYLMSKRFPEPQRLEVWVKTSLWDVPTPEEADEGGMSERDYDPHDDLHPRALLIRQDGNELFRYTANSKAPYVNMRTVILKGKDPHAPAGR